MEQGRLESAFNKALILIAVFMIGMFFGIKPMADKMDIFKEYTLEMCIEKRALNACEVLGRHLGKKDEKR